MNILSIIIFFCFLFDHSLNNACVWGPFISLIIILRRVTAWPSSEVVVWIWAPGFGPPWVTAWSSSESVARTPRVQLRGLLSPLKGAASILDPKPGGGDRWSFWCFGSIAFCGCQVLQSMCKCRRCMAQSFGSTPRCDGTGATEHSRW